MSGKGPSSFDDELFDLMLRHAVIESAQAQAQQVMDAAPAAEDPFPPSERYLRRIERAHRRQKRALFVQLHRRALKTAASVLLVLFGLAATSFVTVSAVRAGFLNFLLGEASDHTKVMLSDAAEGYDLANLPEGWDAIYIPTYLPEGFQLDKVTIGKEAVIAQYIDGKNRYITITQWNRPDVSIFLDNEHGQLQPHTVNDNAALIRSDGTDTSIAWTKDDYSFLVMSSLSQNDLLNTCESLKKYEKELS
ncbi:DUF4367 domain-containing protein [Anaerofilum sp. BX8]|uniref:DUF4367 domain-containing protein n=1 Tax=Anaerofilum hominis TaxID=2763016 RepID=A0A923KW59_9FIRM|nr:DUF4367 domain-containing protein [Anaerofilum hominis]MBC5581526.1 DUF4367 domain-containing protein [Anaerofilum hominis]